MLNPKFFADDTNIFVHGHSLSDLNFKCQITIEKIYDLIIANRLSLNLDKTCYMIFAPSTLHGSSADLTLTINGIPLPRVKSTKYLGLVVDDKLDWISHIQDLCTLLRKYIGIFYKLSLKLPAKILNMLYFSLIYPRLLYGIEVYANTYLCHLHNLIVLNNRLLRIIQHKSLVTSTISLYSSLNTLPIDELFKYQILLHAHNIFFGSKLLPSFFTQIIFSIVMSILISVAQRMIFIVIYLILVFDQKILIILIPCCGIP